MLRKISPSNETIKKLVAVLKSKHSQNPDRPFAAGELRTFAENNYTAPFRLKDWSEQLAMDKYKLIRAFKNETGMSPNQYIIHRRILSSLKQLKNGKPIINTALDCGFFDEAHYHKFFKKIMGITPKVFQNSLAGCNIVQDDQSFDT